MKKILLALALVFALVAPLNASAAIKAGASCKKAGQTSTVVGKKYTCIKSGKKLVWNKGVSIAKPKPVATPTPTPSPTTTPKVEVAPTPTPAPSVSKRPITQFGSRRQTLEYITPYPVTGSPTSRITPVTELAPIEKCKIPDAGFNGAIPNNPQRHFSSGFPIYKERAKLTDNPTIQVIAIDFPDLQGTSSPTTDLKKVTDYVSTYFSRQSAGKFEIKWSIPSTYVRMPKKIGDYDLGGEFFTGGFKPENSWAYVRAAIAETDLGIDFSQASVIAVVVPPQVTRQQIGTFVAQSGEPGQQFKTSEKDIFNVLIMSGPTSEGINSPYEILNWTHELLHMFGLTDLRDTSNVANQISSDLGVFDLMNAYIANELLAWNRFILGALEDKQVRCVVDIKESVHHIYPVGVQNNLTKMVVIPVDKYKAVIVESRRSYGYDSNLGWANEGALVYTLDTSIPYRKSPITVIASPTSIDPTWRTDAALKLNETVTTNGWKITNVETGDFGDVVKVEKVG